MRGRAVILVENLSVPFDRRVWQESTTLAAEGWEVTVICPQGRAVDVAPYERLDGVDIRRYPLAPAAGLTGYAREYATAVFRTARLVGRVAASGPIDVVHACNPPDILLLAALPLRRRAAFVFDHHDLVPELYLSRFRRGRDLGYQGTVLAERMTFRRADVVLATNESYRRVALERGRKRPEDVFVVRSAPDLSRFRAVEPDPALRRGSEHLLAYLGVMGPQDGVDHAVRALGLLARRRTDWRAVFVGDGDARRSAERLAAELGLSQLVEFTGRIDDHEVARVLSSADVCLSPDPKNPLNDLSTMNKILEYMAMGRAIVSYDLREARVSAGEAALYAEANDEAAFAAAVDTLLDDPPRREAMGRIGRSRVARELSWERSQASLLAAYDRAREVAAGRRRAPGRVRLALQR